MTTFSNISFTKVKDCLVISLGEDLAGVTLDDLSKTVLQRIHVEECHSMVFEFSSLKFLDSEEFEVLESISKMAAMLGAKTIFSGINTGIIAHLIANNLGTDNIKATLDLNEALDYLGIEVQFG